MGKLSHGPLRTAVCSAPLGEQALGADPFRHSPASAGTSCLGAGILRNPEL